ncbi:hypothetical protein Ade02nite_90680 [Paractinoplanes deccanensis]|uniref:Uncharacterized protein n=1 Tax=Paractinoplanes deccanensis TaxID=113561 RepID=A0ABQ3YK97_9ACTN|nr:hypothetical protein Ade02nite_90680 [Actinoplanes deccanensis]
MPTHCDPCPGKTNATRGPVTAVPRTIPGASAASARARSRAGRSASRSGSRTARVPNEARVVTSDRPASNGSPSYARRRSACAASAVSDGADSTQGTTPSGRSAGTGSSGAACSRITCALVPLIPKLDTPARRGRPESGHGTASAATSTAPAPQSTCDEGASTCNVRGTTPCRIAITILITPATPAAACV